MRVSVDYGGLSTSTGYRVLVLVVPGSYLVCDSVGRPRDKVTVVISLDRTRVQRTSTE